MMVTCAISWLRCRRLQPDERPFIALNIKLPFHTEIGIVDEALIILLAMSLVGASFALYRAATSPKGPDKFTEFYLLSADGEQESYPVRVTVGERASVSTMLSVVNREQASVVYEIEVRVEKQAVGRVEPIHLKDGQKWEQQVTFTLPQVGGNAKVEFSLYKAQSKQPYRSLHVWIQRPERER